ncbi:DEAD_2 domain-containing protein [Neobacillus bataviensis LMG 21833]|uniref:DEAD_2 domain-containing protein n=1 Tax=Neobacillus bataviensis LMG 21833 TaxID=1117379 RepID=K6C2R4_9BACI|nr:ATP-dependent DNA helicase [Neobacillus bataviensis]EKN65440.1 DEAD_2 domain-containing protein [Neobacillus bataviensis LMG 21833]
MSNDVHISVRNLVEYVYKSGSIDARFRSQSTLSDGTRIHQKIQKTYRDGDQKEVYLSTEIPYDGLIFFIDGRCDGLLFDDGKVTIDEIKSFSQPLEQLEGEGFPVHWAQAKMYAYTYAKDNSLPEILVQLTYVHVETEEKRYFKKSYTFSELEEFVFQVIDGYAPYAKLQHNHQSRRNESCKELAFPFETYRAGQRKLAGGVYKTILEGKNLFAKAPTGIGKTISTLFPTIKAIGEGQLNRIFYLTAKTITRTTAEETFSRMRSCGLCLKVVTITAKDKVCFKEETKCQKDYCEFADGYYDRINDAVLDILSNDSAMTREVIESYARKHTVCPFEYSLDLAYAVDAIICDYNYVFDPRVSLKRLFEEQKKSTALLVDEAHNLVDRGREMFSASLNKETFLQLKKDFNGVNKVIYGAASKLNASFISLKKDHATKTEFILEQLDEAFLDQLTQFLKEAEQVLKTETSQNLLEAYFMVNNFLKIIDLLDKQYVIYGEKNQNDVTVKLFCIDPAKLLRQMGKGYRAKVFFSATLSPLPYYQDILGGDEEDYVQSIPSPFREEQVDAFIKPLSTRFKDRDRTKNSIIAMVQSLINNRPGNYLIFFPSYQYLLSVYEQFKQVDEETQTLIQSTGMTEEEREEFLAAFKADQNKTLLGFAVLGGIFSEGIDLIGDRLNGVVVVGVGLPQLCFERNLIKDHFNKQGKNGYDYAYVYPGMNKVLQAGGRLIRSETDHGTIVLVDDRFLQKQYQMLLPQEWKQFTII